MNIIDDLQQRHVEFRSLTQEINTAAAGGKLTFYIFAALAEFERALIIERAREGIKAAKAPGVKAGASRRLLRNRWSMPVSLSTGESVEKPLRLCSTLIALRCTEGFCKLYALGARSLRKPNISRMGYNPANFAYWIGEPPWIPGYLVSYAIGFYDATTDTESERSNWWGPKTDPKKLYGGFGLIRIPTDPTGQATARRIYRRFEGEEERLIHELADNTTTTFQDNVR